MRKIPSDLRGVLWSRKIKALNPKKDKNYIIHHILAYGTFGQVRWLFNVFSKEEIKESFLESPRKVYSPAAFNFVKNYILDLRGKRVDVHAYLKTLF